MGTADVLNDSKTKGLLIVRHCVAAIAILIGFHAGTLPSSAETTTISSSITYDGTVQSYSQPSGSLVIDGSSSPVLTLINSATTSGITGLYIGSIPGNAGELFVLSGSTLTTNDDSHLGFNTGSTGSAAISGTGSQWNLGIGNLFVGSSGNGTLTISNGGTVNSGYGFVGYEAGSTGGVAGSGSRRDLGSGYLYLGEIADNGVLAISSGGTPTREQGVLTISSNTPHNGGTFSISPGTLHFNEAGTSSATLTLTDSGTTSGIRSLYVDYIAVQTGSFSVLDGSTFTSGNAIFGNAAGMAGLPRSSAPAPTGIRR